MNLPPNVNAVLDRHGQTRFRFRRRGSKSGYLPGPVGSPQFLRAHETLLHSKCGRPRKPRIGIDPFQGVSVVYFIGAKNGPVKIGVSKSVGKRIRALQSSHPRKLYILALAPGSRDLERHYHQMFGEHRRDGEWFKRSKPIEDEISRLKSLISVQPSELRSVQPYENGGKSYG